MIEYNEAEHERLVAGVVKSIHHDLLRNDDVMQAARLGLVEAMAEFDEGKGMQFSTWAWKRIKSRVIDTLRDMDEWRGVAAIESGELLVSDDALSVLERLFEQAHAQNTTRELMRTLTLEEEELVRQVFGIDCEQISISEFARRRGQTQGNLSQTLARILLRMRKIAFRRGILVDSH